MISNNLCSHTMDFANEIVLNTRSELHVPMLFFPAFWLSAKHAFIIVSTPRLCYGVVSRTMLSGPLGLSWLLYRNVFALTKHLIDKTSWFLQYNLGSATGVVMQGSKNSLKPACYWQM